MKCGGEKLTVMNKIAF